MNITKQQIAAELLLIASEYPGEVVPKTEIFNVKVNHWHDNLKNYDYAVIHKAVNMALTSQHFCPKLADIFMQIAKLKAASEPSEDELWNTFVSAAAKAKRLSYSFGYSFREADGLTQGEKAINEANELFDSLPYEIRTYCGNLPGLIHYGAIDREELIQFAKPQLLKRITAIRERDKVLSEMSQDVKAIMTGGETLQFLDSQSIREIPSPTRSYTNEEINARFDRLRAEDI